MIRVLVVDDSATMREFLLAVLSSDPEIAVVGVAADGEEAVARTVALSPDLVTMDIRMPRLDGVSAIRAIMRDRPTPVVVLCSDSNDRTLNISFNALKAGAVDVVEKPRGVTGAEARAFAATFVATIKLMAEVKVVRQFLLDSGEFAPLANEGAGGPARAAIDAVAICSSTGGPVALEYILRHLPASFPAPVAVVQHITEGFLHGLVEWLDRSTPLSVRVAEDGERAEAGSVYFAPEDRHLELAPGSILRFADAPPVRSHRPSGEILFASVAETYGARGMGVMLTGMGEDGADGLDLLAGRGGVVIAQDESTSAIFGMPRAAIERGAATEVVALDRIAPRLVHWAYEGRYGHRNRR
jgi:two-component system chemotaxis response regulator CheB